MTTKSAVDSTYNIEKNLKWVDENNQGVSYFGSHLELLPRDSLRFDTFHMKCSITRRLMSTVRSFILDQLTEVMNSFLQSVLSKFWNDYHLYIWNNKKSFSSMVGNELTFFTSRKLSPHNKKPQHDILDHVEILRVPVSIKDTDFTLPATATKSVLHC